MAFRFTLKHCAPAVAECWRTSRLLLADIRAVRQAEKGGGGDRFFFFRGVVYFAVVMSGSGSNSCRDRSYSF